MKYLLIIINFKGRKKVCVKFSLFQVKKYIKKYFRSHIFFSPANKFLNNSSFAMF